MFSGILFYFILCGISLAILLKSADVFTDNVELLGKKFRIPAFILGVTIVAVGTSIPELASSIMAMNNGVSEIVLGNVMGSNITNILLIVGVCALVLKKEMKLKWNVFHGDVTFLIGSTIILGLILLNGYISILNAIVLIGVYIIYIFYNIGVHKKNNNIKSKEIVVFNGINVLKIIVSIIIVSVSANYFITSAVTISEYLNLGSEIIGLTLVAIGTSLPELAVSFVAARRGSIEIAIGNITGSNIFNISMVIGVSRFFGEIAIPEIIFPLTFIYLLIATFMFIAIAWDNKIHKYEGAILLLLFFLFLMDILS